MNTQFRTIVCSIVIFAASSPEVHAFQPIPIRGAITTNDINASYSPMKSFRSTNTCVQATSNEDNEDFGNASKGDSYDGDVDWDAEWKKVMQNRDQPTSRPGNYKSDVERAMLQTQRVTGEKIKKVKIVAPDINMKSLQSDPKFWIGILAVISIGISLISAAGVETYSNSSENYFI